MGLIYRAAREQVTGQLALFARQKEGLPFRGEPDLPVAIFTAPKSGFPLSAQQVAENIADLLNHKVPLHKLSSGTADIFYSRTDDGIMLRTRGEEGVSVPALTLTVNRKSSVADLAQGVLARMDQDFMRRVCDDIAPDHVPAASAQQKGPSGPGARL